MEDEKKIIFEKPPGLIALDEVLREDRSQTKKAQPLHMRVMERKKTKNKRLKAYLPTTIVVWMTESSSIQKEIHNLFAIMRSEQIARTKSKGLKNPQQIVEKCAENSVNLPIIAKCTKDACTKDAYNKDACTEDACINRDARTEDACIKMIGFKKAYHKSMILTQDACNKMIGFKKAYHKSMILTQDNYHRFNILNKKDDSISDISDKNHLSKAKACLKWLF
jgi:hypothetical protein